MRICVIDDDRISLNVIGAVLARVDDHKVECFASAEFALDRCKEATFDLVLVDYNMPVYNGIDCISQIRSMPSYEFVPIVMLTAENSRDLRLEAVKAGATDFLNKPFVPEELRVRARNLLALRHAQLALMDRAENLNFEVQRATHKLLEQEEELIWRLSRAIETRDGATGQHTSRVARVSEIIARHMGLSKAFCRTVYLASPLHDTGKIGISDAILHKPGKLTSQERKEIEKHSQIGAEILANGQSELIRMAYDIALHHHEKWDGTGYGAGLKGEEIPLSGRITAIADVFDALCSKRSYKPAWTFDEAFSEILNQSGKHFDPNCVAAFSKAREEIRMAYNSIENEDAA
ncbi:UNVERIFIED_CONTAM: hypothetical protein GTU68_043322 [Idotea baltica]|nr:hypothetical protein [Idotea baltica]